MTFETTATTETAVTYAQLLYAAQRERGEQPLFITQEGEFTATALNKLIERYAADLLRMGVKPNEHIAIMSTNSIAWVAAYFAIIKVGAVACLLNCGLSADSTLALLDFVDIDRVLVGPCKMAAQDPNIRETIASTLKLSMDRVLPLCALGQQDPNPDELAVLAYLDSVDDPDRDAAVIFTTGTTSIPKAVLLSQRAILADAGAVARIAGGAIQGYGCVALPMFHVFGLVATIVAIICNVNVILPETPKPEDILPFVHKYDIVAYASIGLVLSKLAQAPEFAERIKPFTRAAILGGGGMTPQQIMQLTQTYGAVMLNGYGQTESAAVISAPSPFDDLTVNAHSVGRIIDVIEVKTCDTQTGAILPDGEEGEIILRGSTIMNGYYKLPQSRQPIDADGWLHTGDMGHITDEHLYLTGRLKDIIIKKGENIAPSEVEIALMQSGMFSAVKVVGVEHPEWGEDIAAVVMLNPAKTFDEEALRVALKHGLDTIKHPSHYIVIDDFPISDTAKIDMKQVRKIAADYVANLA